MKMFQKIGPFTANQEYFFTINGTVCQIGLELGDRVPFAHEDNLLEPIFKVNEKEYTVNDTCILEWGDIATKYVAVTPLKNLDAYTVINVAYE